MDSKRPVGRRGLENKNTRFRQFTWGECAKLREAIQEVRDKLDGHLPLRFKVKL